MAGALARAGHNETQPLLPSEVLHLARTYLPLLVERAKREQRSSSAGLAERPATWAFAALMWRAGADGRCGDAEAWWALTDERFWVELGLSRRPGLAETRRYLAQALKSHELRSPAARALLSVLPDLARSTAFPGSYISVEGRRRVLRSREPVR